MTYFGRALRAVPPEGLTTWLWSDHDGLQISDSPPPGPVPTQHVWAWGPKRWAYWRSEPNRDGVHGLEVVDSPAAPPGTWVQVHLTVFDRQAGSAEAEASQPPLVVQDPRHLFTYNKALDIGTLRDLPVRVLDVTHPSAVALIEILNWKAAAVIPA